jgi:hypothetical protein
VLEFYFGIPIKTIVWGDYYHNVEYVSYPSLPLFLRTPKKLRNHCKKGTLSGKFVSFFRRKYSSFLCEKTVRNLAKGLKTHLLNGLIYFSYQPFLQKINILGDITATRKVFLEEVAPCLKT